MTVTQYDSNRWEFLVNVNDLLSWCNNVSHIQNDWWKKTTTYKHKNYVVFILSRICVRCAISFQLNYIYWIHMEAYLLSVFIFSLYLLLWNRNSDATKWYAFGIFFAKELHISERNKKGFPCTTEKYTNVKSLPKINGFNEGERWPCTLYPTKNMLIWMKATRRIAWKEFFRFFFF